MRQLIILSLLLAACSTKPKEVKTTGSIERIDPTLEKIISPDASIEILAEGYTWSEGPVWVEKENMLLFSDVPENIVYKWTEEKGAEIFLTPSGYTGNSIREGEEGSNGLTLNKDGQLVLCQHGDRRVALLNSDYKNPKPDFKTLAGDYNGKKFNSPNDVVFDKQGNFNFTDPPYGLVNQMTDSTKEIPFQGVYKVKPDGTVILLVDSLTRPNGIGLSPDDKTLYVANSDRPKAKWYSFELQGDSIVSGKIFFSTDYVEGEKGAPDGLKVSSDGTIFSTGPGGIWIFSPAAQVLGKIKLPESAANCALSTDEKTLYITNDMFLLQVKMRK
jgi:gluconolactonase